MSSLNKIPRFKGAAEEAAFWDAHDSAEYIDWSQAKKTVFPNLKPSTESISLRLPAPLLARIKAIAKEKDVPYQSLIKIYISQQIDRELAER